MQLKTITAAKDTGVDGVRFVKTDKAITEVIVGKLHIRKGESYQPGLQVLIEAPHSEETRWRMTATVEGFDPKVSYHDTDYDARVAGGDFEARGANVEYAEVKALVDDNGTVCGFVGDPQPVGDDAEVPF